jgi:hypothetical protein
MARAALSHQFKYLRRAVVAVLNGFDTGQRGPAHAFGRAGVGHHAPARRARRLDNQGQLFERTGGLRGVIRAPVVVGVHFHHVVPFANLLAHSPHEAIGFLGTLGHVFVNG